MKTLFDIVYNEKADACKLDVYLPDTNTNTIIVYFHGGGLERGSKSREKFVEVAKSFVEVGYGFVSADYRMYPTAKFPEYLQDAAKAVAYVKNNYPNVNLIVAGESAGAWLSAMLCLNDKYLLAEGISPKEINGWIIDSAQTTAHFNVLEKEMNLHPLTQVINEYAPLYFVNEKTEFTRMLLIFYTNDMPCRPEQNMLFYKNVLAFNPNAKIEYVKLEGAHCNGTKQKGENGRYLFVNTALEWLAKN